MSLQSTPKYRKPLQAIEFLKLYLGMPVPGVGHKMEKSSIRGDEKVELLGSTPKT